MQDFLDLIKSRRTIRKFKQERIPAEALIQFADCGRLAPSARNLQPLEFFIVDSEMLLEQVFSTLRWAGYIAPEGNPETGETPMAYIVILINETLDSPFATYDAGAAIENMILAALSRGIGSCWLGAVDKNVLCGILQVPEGYRIDSVLALGYPAEAPTMETAEDTIKYYQDEHGVLHVPKRPLEQVIHHNGWRAK